MIRAPAIKGMIDEANYWNQELHAPANSSVGWGCALTGICDIVQNVAEGNYYEAGYGTGGLAMDVTLAAVTAPIGGSAGIATRLIRGFLKGAPDPDAPSIPQVTRNRTIGNMVADAIARQYPGSRREVTMQATSGTRVIDTLTPSGLAIESKVGRVSLTTETRRQIQRDIELVEHARQRCHEGGVALHQESHHRAARTDRSTAAGTATGWHYGGAAMK